MLCFQRSTYNFFKHGYFNSLDLSKGYVIRLFRTYTQIKSQAIWSHESEISSFGIISGPCCFFVDDFLCGWVVQGKKEES